MKAEAAYNTLFDSFQSHLQEAEVVKNRNQTLEGALNSLETENDDLKSLIAELEARPPEIRFITKTETVIVAEDPVLVTPDLPEEHLFTLDPELVVARFSQEEDQYRFETYDMSFRNTMVIADRGTSASLQVRTSYDDQWQEVPVDVEVSRIRDQALWEPHLGVGLTAGLRNLDITGTVFVSVLHPLEGVDLLSGRVSANNHVVALGIDPVGYNLGTRLPVLTDLWVWAGPSINTRGELAVDLTVGSKF